MVVDGWGKNNTFELNRMQVAVPGYGINISGATNIVKCNNTQTGAAKGQQRRLHPLTVPIAHRPLEPNGHTLAWISEGSTVGRPFICCAYKVNVSKLT